MAWRGRKKLGVRRIERAGGRKDLVPWHSGRKRGSKWGERKQKKKKPAGKGWRWWSGGGTEQVERKQEGGGEPGWIDRDEELSE